MDKQAIVADMLELLQGTLDSHMLEEGGEAVRATPELTLIGDTAAVSSMALVSYIADVESMLAEKYDLTLTLVSERALSRKKSPFRSVDALAEYVVELVENPAEIST